MGRLGGEDVHAFRDFADVDELYHSLLHLWPMRTLQPGASPGGADPRPSSSRLRDEGPRVKAAQLVAQIQAEENDAPHYVCINSPGAQPTPTPETSSRMLWERDGWVGPDRVEREPREVHH